MEQEPTLESERLFQGRLVALRIDTVQLPTGRQTRREIVEHGESVAIVALDSEGRALLVRQYRKAPERALLEIPAGGVSAGEQPLDSAQRELQEETGYHAGRLERIGGFYSSPGYCTEFIHLFLATDLKASPLRPDSDEAIEVVRLRLVEAPQLIKSGEMCDAKSIAGLLTVLLRDERFNQPLAPVGDQPDKKGQQGEDMPPVQ